MKSWMLRKLGWKQTLKRVLYIETKFEKSLRQLQSMFVIISLAIVALTMTACSKSIKPYVEKQSPVIPNSLKQPCEKLQPLESGDMPAMAAKLVEVGGAYNRCRESKAALVKAVIKLEGERSAD